jgi:xanthosine utilization system XapX-like protein
MKIIKILGSPVLVMILFLLIIIEGKRFGGIYLLYLLISLPHGAPYAIIAIAGLLSLLIGYNISNNKRRLAKAVLYLTGATFLILSLIMFFIKEPRGNNNATFEQTIPLFTLCLFGFSILCLVINTVIMFRRLNNGNTHSMKAVF